jgi:hypothetical protein
MKKSLHLFSALLILLLLLSRTGSAQCVFSDVQYPTGTTTPTSAWTTVSTAIYAGEYSAYNVVAGNTYEWSLCTNDGGNASYDSQLSLFNSANTGVAIDYEDDFCGDDAKITWVATFSGIAYVQVNEYNCLTNQTATTLVCRLTSGGGTGNPPANDNCIAATNVTVNTFCTGVSGTLTNATGSTTPVTCTGTNTDDVWYRFVCDGSPVINFECIPNGAGFDPVMQAFLGSNCNSLTEIACVDLTLDGQAEVWGIDGASAGQVVYVRIFDYYSAPAVNPNFTFCVYSESTPSIPGDICETAIELPTTAACTNPFGGNFGEFNSDAGFGFDCAGLISSDVWYTFTAISDSIFFDITPFGSTNPIAEAYEGLDCASLTNLGCGDFELEGFAEQLLITPTAPGTRYYVRLYDGSGNVANNLDYDFCVYDSFGSSTTNDECFGATVIEAGTACSPVFSTLEGSTGSNPLTQCGGTNTDDVWFELIASDTAMIIQLAPDFASMDIAAEIFYSTTGDCSGIVSFGCANDSIAGQGELLYITGIQPGESLWLRVYDTGFNPNPTSSFALCAWFDAAIFGVENDECDNSTIIQAGQVCSPVLGTLANSNASLPVTACAGTNTDDVWYQIIASDTAFTIDVTPTGASLDAVLEFFYSTTGDCSGLVSIGCIDNTANGVAESIDVIGLVPGITIWVRVYDYFSGVVADPEFTVCAYWNPDQIFDNDDCLGAVAITPSTTCNPIPFSVANATGSLPAASCSPGGLVEADVWFSFVAQSTAARINVAAVNGSDPVIQYFSGTCGNLISRGCSDFFIEGFDENLTATGLVIGQTYFVRVYDYRGLASPANDFTICITNLTIPANDNCAGAIQLPTLPAGQATYTYFNSALATQSQAGCAGNANDDVWFSFVAGQNPAGTTVNVGGDLDFSTVFQVFSGSCGNLVPVQCVNNVTTGNYDVESQLFTNLVAGQTYYVRVYDFDAAVTNSTFYIYILGTPVPCNIQNPVAAAQGSTTVCSNSFVNLLTPTVSGYSYQWQFNGTPITGATNSVYAASSAGSYNVVITDAQLCSATSNSITISTVIAPVVTLQLGNNTGCVGAAIDLSGGTPEGGLYQGIGVSNNTFLSLNAGSFPITYTYTDQNGCSGTATDEIQAVICTGLDAAIANEIRLFPNPAQNVITLEINGLKIRSVEVVDLSGRIIALESVQNANGTIQFNVAALANGLYGVRCVLDDETIISKRFVKVQ